MVIRMIRRRKLQPKSYKTKPKTIASPWSLTTMLPVPISRTILTQKSKKKKKKNKIVMSTFLKGAQI